MTRTKVLLLGASGSIGASTLDVLRKHADKFELVGVAAGKRHAELIACVKEFRPQVAALTNAAAAKEAAEAIKSLNTKTEWLLDGDQHMSDLARDLDYDVLLASVTGAAGLPAVLEAAKRGKRIALANKESLVITGPLLTAICKETGSELLPVDSEHSALFQILAGVPRDRVRRVVLTASGGPFRGRTRQELREVGPDDALRHPTWDMGAKITIDSATLMNKGLEVIEAHHLFATPYDDIEVVVHPQSVIHGMVRVDDGSVLAHMGPPDMRVPIGYALRWPIPPPERSALDLLGATLQFMPPDADTFRCLPLAVEAGRVGGTAPAALNAANEVAVAAFLERRIGFLDIPETVEHTLNEIQHGDGTDLEAVLAHDARAREVASARIAAVSA